MADYNLFLSVQSELLLKMLEVAKALKAGFEILRTGTLHPHFALSERSFTPVQ
jgi:hypothetical protein